MKKTKKLAFDRTTIRQLTRRDTGRVAGAMSGNVRCTQSGCASNACTDPEIMCPASVEYCPTFGGCF